MNPAILALANTLGVNEPPSVDVAIDEDTRWNVISAGKAGVVVLRTDPQGHDWTFTRFDTSLKQVWERKWTAPSDGELQTWATTEDAVWVLLYERERGVVDLTRIATADGSTRVVSAITPAVAPYMVDLRVEGNDAWVLTADAQPVNAAEGQLLHVDLTRGTVNTVDVAQSLGAMSAPYYQPFEDGETGTDLIAVTRHAGHNRMDVFRLGPDGLGTPTTVPAAEDHNLVIARRHVLQDGSQLVIGNYDDDANGQSAQGLFLSHWEGGAERFRTFTNYTELHHFYDSLPARQREWIRSTIDRKRARQRDFDFPWVVQVDDVVELQDRYLVVAEAWLPQYEREMRTSYEVVRGRSVGSTKPVNVFTGWLLTHALVMSFDKEGTLQWDRSVSLGETLSQHLHPRVQVRAEGDTLELNWPRGGKLHWATVGPDGEFTTMDEHEPVDPVDATILATQSRADSATLVGDSFVSWSVEKEGELADRHEVLRIRRVEP